MKIYLIISLFMSIFTSCDKSGKTEERKSLTAKTLLNVSYGPDTAQRMDIYLPANRTTENTKVIVLIHGGAWAEGDKNDFASYISLIKERLPDYAIVNMNYRLASQLVNHFPTQENDVKAVITTLYDKRKEYAISDKIVLLGASAGGHLALLHAYKYNTPVKAKAVISFFGPTDLAAMYNVQSSPFYQYALQLLIGGTPASNKGAYDQASPIFFASGQSCPTLLLHGGSDGLVSPEQSKTLKNKLEQAGVPVELVLYPKVGHGWYGANLVNSFDKIAAFLKAHVQ
ncbi:MAG: alpha/beta hydrolase [Flavisolibacter sp.]|nr:alpha/beta hydrolase [Flavisolibacter sp.]